MTTADGARGRARVRDPEDKRRRILAAARALFDAHGVDGTTTARVARAAGVSEGTVFHHFGSKQELVLSLAAAWGEGLAVVVTDLEGVDAVVRGVFAYAREHALLREALALGADPARWSGAYAASRDEVVAAIAASIRRDRARGRGRPVDPDIAAALVFGVVETALRECFVRDGGRHEEAFAREAVAFVRGALGSPADDRPQGRGGREGPPLPEGDRNRHDPGMTPFPGRGPRTDDTAGGGRR